MFAEYFLHMLCLSYIIYIIPFTFAPATENYWNYFYLFYE